MEETMRQTLLMLAREARHRPTPAEDLLWEQLRDHRCGLHFRRQDIVGPFRLDFYCRKAKLAVEVDGSKSCNKSSASSLCALLMMILSTV